MTPLDELRALALDCASGAPWDGCPCEKCRLARAVLEMLPVVERAVAQEQARLEYDVSRSIDDGMTTEIQRLGGLMYDAQIALEQAIRAFSAHRERETKAT